MWLRKEKAGTAAGHVWDKDGAVVEVAHHLAAELLAIVGAGFSEAEPPKGASKAAAKDDDGDKEEQPKRRPGRPRKQVTEAPSGDAEGTDDAASDPAKE